MKQVWWCGVLFFLVSLVWAETVEVSSVKLSWEVEGEEVIFTLEAPTKGWIAIGWGATMKMKDADFVVVYVTNGNVGVIEDHFGVSVIGHRRDTELGGKENIRLIEAYEDDNITRVVFARALNTKDAYDVPLVLEKPMDVLLAYGRFDNTSSKHQWREKTRIVLKRKK
ncbi:DOMON domain-containing protein [Thermospira aquatica]|uniref:DOMON domain-containing protein n=1 Tax=Thermospira aquatica TaxID=2828656 RepID=A0AAX3BCM6_9SPIR|nr:DOMON domain-containing protein [Thermospira aquatica]URA09949.1 hypothetical protein KDW03_10780 [Thermospira aquatica]